MFSGSPHEFQPKDTSEIPGSRTSRDLYSPAQLRAYFMRISLNEKYRSSPIFDDPSLARTHEHGMPVLAALVRQHQAKIPYENLNVHCYPSPVTTLDVQNLYNTIVASGRGRGGTCSMVNGLLSNVLQTLGFEVFEVGARVNNACQRVASTPEYKGPRYNGWDHMVLLVIFSEQAYLVDVGMGHRGPIITLPLRHCVTATSIAPSQVRLLHGHIPENSSQRPSNKLWRLESRKNKDSDWRPTYAFSEIEFFQHDFEVMCWYSSTNPRSWLVHDVVATRLILNDAEDELIGFVSLSGSVLTISKHGRLEFSRQCHGDKEIVESMRTHLGIELTLEEEANLKISLARMSTQKM